MDETLIHYTDVEIHQQELCVLSEVNLQLHKGEFVYLVGKVGSGKTSLLKTLYGELDVTAGEAEVLGYRMTSIKRKHIPQLRRKLGIVFQDFQLLTDLAALADRRSGEGGRSPLGRRLRLCRNADAVFRVAFCLLPYLANWRWVELLIALLSLLWLGTCAVICCGLFALRRLYPAEEDE